MICAEDEMADPHITSVVDQMGIGNKHVWCYCIVVFILRI